MTKLMKNKKYVIILIIWISIFILNNIFLNLSQNSNNGVILHYEEEGRMWNAWVASDIDNDNIREIMICGAIYSKCLSTNSQIRWSQNYLHHEVFWGCDSGIDVNGDGITEQLVFETVWNNHYLLDGLSGIALESINEENRREGLYWPIIHCGFGLNVDVNGNGVNDYVICGIKSWDWGEIVPVVQCYESINGSIIWEYKLTNIINGIIPIKINGINQILVLSNNITALSTDGTLLWNNVNGTWSMAVIPNGAGVGNDAIVSLKNGINYINASDGTLIWTESTNLITVNYCGDVNNDGQGDFGALWPSGLKTGVFYGNNGTLIRNHSAQNLENAMHGITYCGDVNNDGFEDYGIYGDFSPHEVFSGIDGSQLLSIGNNDFHGAEEMYLVEDVNNNGFQDIMLFNGGVTIIDGNTLGHVEWISNGGGISGYSYSWMILIISCVSIIYIINFQKKKRKLK